MAWGGGRGVYVSGMKVAEYLPGFDASFDIIESLVTVVSVC